MISTYFLVWNLWFNSVFLSFSPFPMSLEHGILWIESTARIQSLCLHCTLVSGPNGSLSVIFWGHNEPWKGFHMGILMGALTGRGLHSREKSDSPNRIVGHFENVAIVFIQETPCSNVLWLDPYVSTEITLMVVLYGEEALFPKHWHSFYCSCTVCLTAMWNPFVITHRSHVKLK